MSRVFFLHIRTQRHFADLEIGKANSFNSPL